MVLKAAYFRSNPKHTEKQLLKVFLSTESDHLQAEVSVIFQKIREVNTHLADWAQHQADKEMA